MPMDRLSERPLPRIRYARPNRFRSFPHLRENWASADSGLPQLLELLISRSAGTLFGRAATLMRYHGIQRLGIDSAYRYGKTTGRSDSRCRSYSDNGPVAICDLAEQWTSAG